MQARSDEGFSYMSGLHLIAANLLLNMPPTSGSSASLSCDCTGAVTHGTFFAAWKTLLNLLSSSGCLRAFYDPEGQAEREAYYRVLNTLCERLSRIAVIRIVLNPNLLRLQVATPSQKVWFAFDHSPHLTLPLSSAAFSMQFTTT